MHVELNIMEKMEDPRLINTRSMFISSTHSHTRTHESMIDVIFPTIVGGIVVVACMRVPL